MPKRPNPFGDCSPLQYKTHIGRKEVDSGVCRDEKMKQVYERTRQLLYTGAQKQTADIPRDANYNHLPIDGDDLAAEKNIPGQMCIDKHLNLTQPSSHSQTKQTSKESQMKCCVCKNLIKKNPVECNFCDKGGCQSCFRQCYNCSGVFCHLCSLVNYDENFERNFCLSCAS